MKLNYDVENKIKKEESAEWTPKNNTKISMQATVNEALASKLPTAPANPQLASTNKGWGSTN